jgi:phosphatidylserine/phosphatidylglycerophosphate/cardiolipin synthase-like enzyme
MRPRGETQLRLLVQPADGIAALLEGINTAKKSIEIVIFRFDRAEIETALKRAVQRGVFVHALIAYTNRGGEKHLRDLEMNLLAAGVTVARTADDLLRYHDKFMVIDRTTLYVLAFNFTYLDIEHSRSFGIVTRNRQMVQEAVKLFEADTKRQAYTAGLKDFVVSPVNARKELAAFIKGARKQLLIYDPKISDSAMLRLLQDRAKSGVEVRIIGRVTRRTAKLDVERLYRLRLHTRAIIRDRRQAFVGSQSLRDAELDKRRELGLILRDAKVVNSLTGVFEDDWAQIQAFKEQVKKEAVLPPVEEATKQVVKAIAKDLPPVAPILEQVVKQVAGAEPQLDFDMQEVEETVKDAVKDAVREVVKEVVQEAIEINGLQGGAK